VSISNASPSYQVHPSIQVSSAAHALTWLFIMLTGVFGLLYLVAPAGYGMFVLVSAIMLTVALLSVALPATLLFFVLTTSVFSSILRNADSVTIGSTTVSLSGIRWIWVASIAVAVLTVNWRRVEWRGPFSWLLIFSAWVVLRWFATPTGVGLRDVLFYALPVLLALYTRLVLTANGGPSIERISKVLLCTAVIPPVAYAVLIPAGLVTFQDFGPEGLIDPRTICEYLLIVLAVAASWWQYGPNKRIRGYGFATCILCLATSVLTLSRAPTIVGIVMLMVARTKSGQVRKLLFSMVTAASLTAGLLWLVPAFRSRFSGTEGTLSGDFPYVNTEGRAFFWAVTADNAIQKPVLGWGPGNARLLLGAAIPDSDYEEYHPHNEYLQVFNDLGLIGLVLMLLGWVPLVRVHWRRWRCYDMLGESIAAQWHMAAALALLVVLLNSLVGNTLHETFVAAPALIISSCAFFYSASGRNIGNQNAK
jgi:O-antigen ligase